MPSRRASPRRLRARTTEGRCSGSAPDDKLASSPSGRVIVKARILFGAVFAAVVAMSPAIAQSNLRIGLAEDPDNLDPTTAGSYVGRIVLAAMCDKLFDIDEKLNIVPQLALSHETSADGKTVTIKLRPSVKFHDGEPFNAEAVKFTLERGLTKDD